MKPSSLNTIPSSNTRLPSEGVGSLSTQAWKKSNHFKTLHPSSPPRSIANGSQKTNDQQNLRLVFSGNSNSTLMGRKWYFLGIFLALCDFEPQLDTKADKIAALSRLSYPGSAGPQARYMGQFPGSSCPVNHPVKVVSKWCDPFRNWWEYKRGEDKRLLSPLFLSDRMTFALREEPSSWRCGVSYEFDNCELCTSPMGNVPSYRLDRVRLCIPMLRMRSEI